MTAAPDAGEVVIRPLMEADLDAVMQIEEEAFSTPWSRGTFRDLLRRQDTDLFAATLHDRLVGYAICWTVFDQAELGNVAVAPDARGAGVGRRLVRRVLERVRARGATECFLEVRMSNKGAIRLYEHLGFMRVGERRDYYRKPIEAALVMRADLV